MGVHFNDARFFISYDTDCLKTYNYERINTLFSCGLQRIKTIAAVITSTRKSGILALCQL